MSSGVSFSAAMRKAQSLAEIFAATLLPPETPVLVSRIFWRTVSTALLAMALGVVLAVGVAQTGAGRPLGQWLCWFGTFALFSAWNFLGIIRFVNRVIPSGWGRGTGLKAFFNAQLRLFLTAFFIYSAVVWWTAPISAMVSGLSMTLVWIVIIGVFQPEPR